jgi:hypothetical protein
MGVSSDVIEAHVRRLPRVERALWTPRPVDRGALERALLGGGVAGVATHPLENVRGNAQLLLDRDPDKEFGLSGLREGMTLDRVLALVEEAAGAPIDREARYGPVEIRPEPILEACREAAARLARAWTGRRSRSRPGTRPDSRTCTTNSRSSWGDEERRSRSPREGSIGAMEG